MSLRDNRPEIVGHRLPRLGGAPKVTGTYTYGAAFALPGTLHGKILRSTVPHGRLIRIDTRRARAMPGVRAIITAADIPATRFGNAVKDQTAFATDTVRFVGHPLAAVAAATLEEAAAALEKITVEIEPLPPLYDPEAALEPTAAVLHPEWQSYWAMPVIARDRNVAGRSRMRHGDVEVAFAQAYRV